ncbi:GFA family protein [Alkalimarinus alittae]
MLKGSCLCRQVQYEIKSMPRKVSHCHCRMCQKQHGAA